MTRHRLLNIFSRRGVLSIVWVGAISALLTGPATAAISIDGALGPNEWGVTFTGDALSFDPGVVNSAVHPGVLGTALIGGNTIYYAAEDQPDSWGHDMFLGPQYGGQDYDTEYVAVAASGGKLLIGIVTGQRPDNGFKYYIPGDIGIVTSAGMFGVEVGGGAGGVAPGNMIAAGASGSTYHLNSSGIAQSVTNHVGLSTAGSIWRTDLSDWIVDPIVDSSTIPVQLNHAMLAAADFVGTASFFSTRNSLANSHALIEVGIDFSLFGPGVSIHKVFWDPACGNDGLAVEFPADGLLPVPEPSTLGIWGLLLSCLAGTGWLRGRRAG